MLEFVKGDFFDYDADIRINTVNCVGVMGAGVALAFKNKYPEMFKEYVKICKSGELKPGKPVSWSNEDMFSAGITIINFPTKDHWRRPSEYEYVENGLKWLANYLLDKKDKVVTLPALGCGHGGLKWEEVKVLIHTYLEKSPAKILIFEPSSSKKAGKLNLDLSKLSSVGINTISDKSLEYPKDLRSLPKKNLYFFGENSENINYDVSLICSTKPSDTEKNIIRQFIEFSTENNLRVMLGSSVFEKKIAIEYVKNGLEVGVFVPSGIYNSVSKLLDSNLRNKINLFSFGDPYKDFDRKEYLSSVLARLFISEQVVFTTDRLAWISKQKTKINKNKILSQYIQYPSLGEDDIKAVGDINSEAVPYDNITQSVTFNTVTSLSKGTS